jgi:hypothetical protein
VLIIPSRRLVLAAAARVVLQLGLLFAILQGYSYFRKTFFQQPVERAYGNAFDIIDLQAAIGIPVERIELRLQRAVIAHTWLTDLFNSYYRQMKPAIYVSAALALLLAPVAFRKVRRVFLLATLVALPWYALYPLAPPRLMGDHGYPFVDTLAVFGGTVSSSAGAGGANQFAAMPSMHIGWSIVVALWLAVAFPPCRIGAIVGATHVLIMSITVMATGNHFALDIVGGIVVVAAALLLDRILPGESFGSRAERAVRSPSAVRYAAP